MAFKSPITNLSNSYTEFLLHIGVIRIGVKDPIALKPDLNHNSK